MAWLVTAVSRNLHPEARHADRYREEPERRRISPFSSHVLGGQAGSKLWDFKTWFIPGTGVTSEAGLRGPKGTSARKAMCVTSGARCLPLPRPSGGSLPSALTHVLYP